ncbi:MAG TPA: cofactor-independent phosphoglycerate mutase [Candidatus Blautia avistercoris]|uniref:cofactor-independent phosphoglycerate mutase n=1 Tax=Blautia sp. An249 TaxID=1965603 RepID=UPI000B38C44B|nr:cofactor-independent phosphoglycerate mutase [Blautia sp. An249]OUO79099.1 cofactor-independent phosphoglycerate mutase [Blautia sp. An249]HIY18988.1 cofactor-independent phosphoglycerate mutase [Candidatus Blautia avistercoris]
MKYIVILGDGMADWPLEELGQKTPLEYAHTPVMDELAKRSEVGMAQTIPEGMSPGSDTANLSVMGYDPRKYYTGRSPLEALSIGIDMKPEDMVFRCNIVTLTEKDAPYEEQVILDHCSDEICTEDSRVLLEAVLSQMDYPEYVFYPGTGYRHCMIWEKGQKPRLTPPHDVLGQTIGQYLPDNEDFLAMQKKSYEILKDHPINVERKKKGLHPANSFWFWGAGTKPALSSFFEEHQKKGAMISAVDLLKGIAVGASMDNITVEGANGGFDTNYEGKADAAVKALTEDGYDFVYVHVEAPDEMGHQGHIDKKIKSIEFLDSRVIARVKAGLDASGEDYRMMILPDHPTPIAARTHVSDPVPYLLYDSKNPQNHTWNYNEREVRAASGETVCGWDLMNHLLQQK